MCIWVYDLHFWLYHFHFEVYHFHSSIHLTFYRCACLGIRFMFGCALFTQVCFVHLGMPFSFRHIVYIWVSHFHSGIHFSFEYTIFIQVYTLPLGKPFSFRHTFFIWHAILYTFYIWVCYF